MIAPQVSSWPHFGSMPISASRALPSIAIGKPSCGREQQRPVAGHVVVEARRRGGERAVGPRGADVVRERRPRRIGRQRPAVPVLERRGDPRQDPRDVGVDDALREKRADRPDERREQEQEERQREQDRAALRAALGAGEPAPETAVVPRRRAAAHRGMSAGPRPPRRRARHGQRRSTSRPRR